MLIFPGVRHYLSNRLQYQYLGLQIIFMVNGSGDKNDYVIQQKEVISNEGIYMSYKYSTNQ